MNDIFSMVVYHLNMKPLTKKMRNTPYILDASLKKQDTY